jgi:hypothetical protein
MIVAALALAWPASTAFAQTASESSETASKTDNAGTVATPAASEKIVSKSDKADGKTAKADGKTGAKAADDKSDKAGKEDASAASGSGAQAVPAPATAPAAAATVAKEERDDAVFNPAQPDFTLITLPTGLRLPQFKSAFRVTHRFSRPLGQGSFGDLASDLFAFDSAAQIGLEYRFGILPGLQGGLQRTSDRDIQFFAQYNVVEQSDHMPISLSAIGSIDGTNNFKDSKSPGIGAIVGRTFGKIGAFYVEPIWVNNTNPQPKELVDDNSTFMIGIGGRVQVRKDLYIVVEAMPRVGGYEPGVNGGGFALEKHVGGHIFQINFSKGFGTTMAQIARGGPAGNDWFIGFNLTRKFY